MGWGFDLLGGRLGWPNDREAALTITAAIRMVNPLVEGNEGESLHPRTYDSDS